MQRVARIDRLQDQRRLGDVPDPDNAERNEPERAYRTEKQADDAGAESLNHEKRDKNSGRDRHNVRLEGRGSYFQSFDGGKNRDRGRQDRVAVEQRCSKHANAEQCGPQSWPVTDRRCRESQQRHDAAFTAIVRTQYERHVFQRNYDHQQPEDRGDATDDVLRSQWDAVLWIERFLCGIERAGADIAVDDTQRQKGERGRCLLAVRRFCSRGRRGY